MSGQSTSSIDTPVAPGSNGSAPFSYIVPSRTGIRYMSYADFKGAFQDSSTDIPVPRAFVQGADRYFRAEQELSQTGVGLTDKNVSQCAAKLPYPKEGHKVSEYRGQFARELIQTPTSSSKNPGTPVDTLICKPLATSQSTSVSPRTDPPQFRLMGALFTVKSASTAKPQQSADTKKFVIVVEKEAEEYDGYGTNSLLIDDIPAKDYEAIWKTLGKQSFVGKYSQPTREADAFDPLGRLHADVSTYLSSKCQTQASSSAATPSATVTSRKDLLGGSAVTSSEDGDLMTF